MAYRGKGRYCPWDATQTVYSEAPGVWVCSGNDLVGFETNTGWKKDPGPRRGFYCPKCGDMKLHPAGKTAGGLQRFVCSGCGFGAIKTR